MSDKEKSPYQYLNNGHFHFDGEWKYNSKTLDDFKTEILELFADLDPNGDVELYADTINDTEALDRARYHKSPYVEQIFHSHMNLWLHYSLGQVFTKLEKARKLSPEYLENFTDKEATKLIRTADREMQEEYLKIEAKFL